MERCRRWFSDSRGMAAGWSTFGDFALLSPEGFEAGCLGVWDVDDVNLEACHWHGRANVGPSVDELVAGLVGQLGMDVTAPTVIELHGRAGRIVDLDGHRAGLNASVAV